MAQRWLHKTITEYVVQGDYGHGFEDVKVFGDADSKTNKRKASNKLDAMRQSQPNIEFRLHTRSKRIEKRIA